MLVRMGWVLRLMVSTSYCAKGRSYVGKMFFVGSWVLYEILACVMGSSVWSV